MGCTGSKGEKKGKDTSSSSSSSSLTQNNKTIDKTKAELSENEINNLLNKTKFTKQDIVDWWQGFLSDCPSGLLDKKKFVEVYQNRYPNGKAKKFCDHVYRTFNPDKRTHAIDFERFMCAIDITLNGNSDEKLEWAFTMYDVNGDQRISKSEMLSVVESMFDLLGKDKKGPNDPRKHVDQIFLRIDLNRDNYVSKEEFMLGCKTDEQIRTILAPHY
jgi:Ca2+-binding EF-hand superfamily protein